MAIKCTHDFISNYFLINNCILLDKYQNNHTPMNYICECENQSKITWSKFKDGQRCRKCKNEKIGDKLRPKHEDIQKKFEAVGMVLLEKEYKNAHTKMQYLCKCGEVNFITMHCFNRGQVCLKCSILKRNKKNHYKWNPSLSDVERSKNRGPQFKKWRKKILKRDGYKCMACDSKGIMNAHHLNNWSQFINERFELDNGITLCENCHIGFHKQYGYKDTTKEMFKEWSKQFVK